MLQQARIDYTPYTGSATQSHKHDEQVLHFLSRSPHRKPPEHDTIHDSADDLARDRMMEKGGGQNGWPESAEDGEREIMRLQEVVAEREREMAERESGREREVRELEEMVRRGKVEREREWKERMREDREREKEGEERELERERERAERERDDAEREKRRARELVEKSREKELVEKQVAAWAERYHTLEAHTFTPQFDKDEGAAPSLAPSPSSPVESRKGVSPVKMLLECVQQQQQQQQQHQNETQICAECEQVKNLSDILRARYTPRERVGRSLS